MSVWKKTSGDTNDRNEIELEETRHDVRVHPIERGQQPHLLYGIDQAVSLISQLPARDPCLEILVVKKTLESLNVSVPHVVQGASKRVDAIGTQMSALADAIDVLENEIGGKKRALSRLAEEKKAIIAARDQLSDPPQQRVDSFAVSARVAPSVVGIATLPPVSETGNSSSKPAPDDAGANVTRTARVRRQSTGPGPRAKHPAPASPVSNG